MNLTPDLITFAAVVGLIGISAGLCLALHVALKARDRAEGRARRAERLLNISRPEVMAALQRKEVQR